VEESLVGVPLVYEPVTGARVRRAPSLQKGCVSLAHSGTSVPSPAGKMKAWVDMAALDQHCGHATNPCCSVM